MTAIAVTLMCILLAAFCEAGSFRGATEAPLGSYIPPARPIHLSEDVQILSLRREQGTAPSQGECHLARLNLALNVRCAHP